MLPVYCKAAQPLCRPPPCTGSLGYVTNSPYFRHNAENPLAADIIVIDEASMIDLPLLAKLMQAVACYSPANTPGRPASVGLCTARLLSSVIFVTQKQCRVFPKNSVGSLQNLAAFPLHLRLFPGQKPFPASLQDSFVELVQNYRFNSESGIAKLSLAVREGVWRWGS